MCDTFVDLSLGLNEGAEAGFLFDFKGFVESRSSQVCFDEERFFTSNGAGDSEVERGHGFTVVGLSTGDE